MATVIKTQKKAIELLNDGYYIYETSLRNPYSYAFSCHGKQSYTGDCTLIHKLLKKGVIKNAPKEWTSTVYYEKATEVIKATNK
jgi:hypothetical protein